MIIEKLKKASSNKKIQFSPIADSSGRSRIAIRIKTGSLTQTKFDISNMGGSKKLGLR